MSKLMKAIINPKFAIKVLHNRTRIAHSHNKIKAKQSGRRNGVRLDLGEKISFH